MRDWDFLQELPPDHEVVEGRQGVLVCRSGWRGGLVAAGFGPDRKLGPGTGTSSDLGEAPRGRMPVQLLKVEDAELVVRRHTHGGLLRGVLGDRFWNAERPFDELVLSAQLVERGLPTPEVIAARAERAGFGAWRLCLVTRRVSGAIDGGDLLGHFAAGSLTAERKHALTSQVGEFVAQLHAAGLWHADLTPNNILFGDEVLRGERPRLWILDLDRSSLRSGLGPAERAQNLERFLRSVVKRQRHTPAGLDRSDAVRFLKSYVGGLGQDEGSWRGEWQAMARLEQRGRLAHRASWFLEQIFAGGGPNQRRVG